MKKKQFERDADGNYVEVEKDNSNAGLFAGLAIASLAFLVVIIAIFSIGNDKQRDLNNIQIELPGLEGKEGSQDLDVDLSLPGGETNIQTPGPVITPPVVTPQPDINIDDSEEDNKVEVEVEPTPPIVEEPTPAPEVETQPEEEEVESPAPKKEPTEFVAPQILDNQ